MHPKLANLMRAIEDWQKGGRLYEADLLAAYYHLQAHLTTEHPEEHAFGGVTYDPIEDYERLSKQMKVVVLIMRQQGDEYLTLAEIVYIAREKYNLPTSEAGVSARLRDLRKKKYGGQTIERRRHPGSNGQWEYRWQVRGTK